MSDPPTNTVSFRKLSKTPVLFIHSLKPTFKELSIINYFHGELKSYGECDMQIGTTHHSELQNNDILTAFFEVERLFHSFGANNFSSNFLNHFMKRFMQSTILVLFLTETMMKENFGRFLLNLLTLDYATLGIGHSQNLFILRLCDVPILQTVPAVNIDCLVDLYKNNNSKHIQKALNCLLNELLVLTAKGEPQNTTTEFNFTASDQSITRPLHPTNKPLLSWTIDEMNRVLYEYGVNSYFRETFEDFKIDGQMFLSLTLKDLAETICPDYSPSTLYKFCQKMALLPRIVARFEEDHQKCRDYQPRIDIAFLLHCEENRCMAESITKKLTRMALCRQDYSRNRRYQVSPANQHELEHSLAAAGHTIVLLTQEALESEQFLANLIFWFSLPRKLDMRLVERKMAETFLHDYRESNWLFRSSEKPPNRTLWIVYLLPQWSCLPPMIYALLENHVCVNLQAVTFDQGLEILSEAIIMCDLHQSSSLGASFSGLALVQYESNFLHHLREVAQTLRTVVNKQNCLEEREDADGQKVYLSASLAQPVERINLIARILRTRGFRVSPATTHEHSGLDASNFLLNSSEAMKMNDRYNSRAYLNESGVQDADAVLICLDEVYFKNSTCVQELCLAAVAEKCIKLLLLGKIRPRSLSDPISLAHSLAADAPAKIRQIIQSIIKKDSESVIDLTNKKLFRQEMALLCDNLRRTIP